MYVAHLEFLADKGAEIEMAARSRFLGSRLGVLDRDAPLEIDVKIKNSQSHGRTLRSLPREDPCATWNQLPQNSPTLFSDRQQAPHVFITLQTLCSLILNYTTTFSRTIVFELGVA
jgi:hypothetical protein